MSYYAVVGRDSLVFRGRCLRNRQGNPEGRWWVPTLNTVGLMHAVLEVVIDDALETTVTDMFDYLVV